MWNFFNFLPFLLVNRRGSLLLPTTGLTVSATAATFTLPSYRVSGPRGTMLIKISQPIVFTANGGTQAATKVGGDPLTIADIPGTGVYEFYYDRESSTLQLLGTAAAATATTQG